MGKDWHEIPINFIPTHWAMFQWAQLPTTGPTSTPGGTPVPPKHADESADDGFVELVPPPDAEHVGPTPGTGVGVSAPTASDSQLAAKVHQLEKQLQIQGGVVQQLEKQLQSQEDRLRRLEDRSLLVDV